MSLPQFHFQTHDNCRLNSHCLEEHRRVCRHPQHGDCHHFPAATPAGAYECMIDYRCRTVHHQRCTGCPNSAAAPEDEQP